MPYSRACVCGWRARMCASVQEFNAMMEAGLKPLEACSLGLLKIAVKTYKAQLNCLQLPISQRCESGDILALTRAAHAELQDSYSEDAFWQDSMVNMDSAVILYVLPYNTKVM